MPDVIQDTLAAALKPLPLTRLRLRIAVRFANPPGTPVPSPCIAETTAARIDVPAFVRGLRAAIPTLTDAYVTLDRWSAAELRARIPNGGAATDDAGDAADECLHWERVPPAHESNPKLAFIEDKKMFELD